MTTYLFFTADGYTPRELPDDAVAIQMATRLRGLLKVERATGEIVWEAKISA